MPMAFGRVTIEIGAIKASIESDHINPDSLNDMTNRCASLIGTTIAQAVASGIDIMEIYDYESESDEDELED